MTGSVRFVLGGRVVEAAGVEATTTVLEWLRAHGRPGSKEGCAEGDCGACTVVLAELDDDGEGLRYRAVNSCILFLPQVDGRMLLTVEDLASDGELHPVQAAMAEAHASQCGFCTPGFVMTLFALFHADRAPTDDAIHDALAGNLCRCTGYRPILDAARRMHALAGDGRDRFDRAEAGIVALLQSIRREGSGGVERHGHALHAPRHLKELQSVVAARPGATILAGGTDVGLWVTKQRRNLPEIVWLGDVAELRTVAERADHLDVGAAVTYEALLPWLDRRFPALAGLVRRIGGMQVRSSGTLAGNIANGSPIGDSMPALLALGARLVLNHGGTRRTVDLDAFYHGYRKTELKRGEFLERVLIPYVPDGVLFATYKVSKRRDQDISAVCAGFRLALDAGGRVAGFRAGYGGMAAVPMRARSLEAALLGEPWTADAVKAALPGLDADFAPITDMRATDAYRRAVARNLLLRFHAYTTGDETHDLEAIHG